MISDGWLAIFDVGTGAMMPFSPLTSSLIPSSAEPEPVFDFACRSGGQAQSRHKRRQSPQRGLVSSHFFLRRLHMRQPVWTRLILALGTSPFGTSSVVPAAFRGRHGRLRRTHRAHGKLPSQACLICAQRWHTGRLSEPILVVYAVVIVPGTTVGEVV